MITDFFGGSKKRPAPEKPNSPVKKPHVTNDGAPSSPHPPPTSSSSSPSLSPAEEMLSHIGNDEWKTALTPYCKKKQFATLATFVRTERKSRTIYPAPQDTFSLFSYTPISSVKVVIIGQDPYHGPGQGHGLSFSVRKGVQIPPSLRNIYKEAVADVGIAKPSHGYLEEWAKQGVFMLNAVLTVRRGEADSHAKQGWEQFTDEVIRILDKNCDGLVFLLWGKKAEKKCERISKSKHTIITSSHPSPLGATKTAKPFIGSKCFSRANEALIAKGRDPINWKISP